MWDIVQAVLKGILQSEIHLSVKKEKVKNKRAGLSSESLLNLEEWAGWEMGRWQEGGDIGMPVTDSSHVRRNQYSVIKQLSLN